MRLQLPFEAALILNKSGLRECYPETWGRYQNQSTIHVGRVVGAHVKTSLGLDDIIIIRNYFELWLAEQELIPQHNRARIQDARRAVYALTGAIETAERTCATVQLC